MWPTCQLFILHATTPILTTSIPILTCIVPLAINFSLTFLRRSHTLFFIMLHKQLRIKPLNTRQTTLVGDWRHHRRDIRVPIRVTMIAVVALLSFMTEATTNLALNARSESFTTATNRCTTTTTSPFNRRRIFNKVCMQVYFLQHLSLTIFTVN
ncbi:hypothetical protein V6Z11_D01G037400 [Gossypium hirsutum]